MRKAKMLITNTILAADNTDGTYTIGIPVTDTTKNYTKYKVAPTLLK